MGSSTKSQAARSPSRLSRFVGLIPGLLLAVALVQRPLDSVDLWWHLARGREVLAGTIFPSRELLTLETLADASWLGGAPFFFAWSLGGVVALGFVPLAAGIALMFFGRLPVSRADKRFALIALSPLILYTVRDDLQAIPRLFDVLGLILTAQLLASSQAASRRRVVATLLLFAAWSNLASGPVWGLLLLMLHCGTRAASGTILLAAVVGGMLNPRGPLAWQDSFVLLTASDSAFSAPETFTTTMAVFLLLWLSWAGWFHVQHRWRLQPLLVSVATFSIPLAAGLMCTRNVPLGGTWILIHLGLLAASPVRQESSRSTPAGRKSGSVDVWDVRLSRASWGMAVGITAVLLMLDCGLLPLAGGKRPGWGIASSIDYRLVDPVWRTSPNESLLTWTPDAGCAGMVAWIGENLQLVDHPQRARLGGRWATHAGVVADIAGDHRAEYRRADGSWGGWRAQLAEWNVSLMAIPAGSNLHEILSTTPWKSLDLDAPCIPYVSTNDLRFASLIVDVLRQQGFVEAGPWQPTLEIYDGHGWRIDLLQMLGLGIDPVPAVAQSRHFRALGLSMAAARALLPVAQTNHTTPVRREWLAVQKALAEQEEDTAGRVSPFRQAIVASATASNEPASSPLLTKVVEQYRQGRLQEALEQLTGSSAEEAYAAAMLRLELGDTITALARLEEVVANGNDRVLTILAQSWLQQIEPFAERSE
ncbi:hypothetical protein Mal4_53220 [Maioricimonas rarisocia]|uniref:Uncharacterized protein n=1 Tax=Maioricimonas rarisocia TaxID=2528026 RepID=A0A517ZEV4_9PLAN|nr:hypothetical protein [Maioricimonas rarisocia]QDU40959.1 hypothetical protein Mal4_53220 [Maioricimonas rarisocia]